MAIKRDYYEILDGDSGDLDFAIGDVSGKGVPAALLMSTLQSSFLAESSAQQDLAKVCERDNEFLTQHTTPERYATFFVGRLTEDAYHVECELVRSSLAREEKPHLDEFARAWSRGEG